MLLHSTFEKAKTEMVAIEYGEDQPRILKGHFSSQKVN